MKLRKIHGSPIPDINEVKNYLIGLQDQLAQFVETQDGETFKEDCWQHTVGTGGGRTRLLIEGNVFEQAGIGFSEIAGNALPAAATKKRPELAGCEFKAMGVSLVFHPRNPYVPTTHANLRFFWVNAPQGAHWWFGGGYDLTPYYPFAEDCIHWHQTAKAACDPFGEELYRQLKRQCDEYFYLPHRQEARGIGGIFFDDLNQWGFERSFAFIKSVGDSFWLAYKPILNHRQHIPYSQHERKARWTGLDLTKRRGVMYQIWR